MWPQTAWHSGPPTLTSLSPTELLEMENKVQAVWNPRNGAQQDDIYKYQKTNGII